MHQCSQRNLSSYSGSTIACCLGCPYAALHFSGWFNFVVPARFLYADAASCVQRLGAAAAAATLMPCAITVAGVVHGPAKRCVWSVTAHAPLLLAAAMNVSISSQQTFVVYD